MGIREEPLLDPSMMVQFACRFTPVHHELINGAIIDAATSAEQKAKDQNRGEGRDEDNPPPPNSGKLQVGATCTPAEVKYTTQRKAIGTFEEANHPERRGTEG